MTEQQQPNAGAAVKPRRWLRPWLGKSEAKAEVALKIPEQRKPAESPKEDAQEKVAPEKERTPLPSTRPPGAPPDPWTVFATTPEQPPGRIRRGLAAVGRTLIHEYALAAYASVVIAVLMTWPAIRYPLHTLPQDLGDPSRQAWQLAWAGHILITDPKLLWHANAYFPLTDSYAFGDSLLGYAPFAMLSNGPVTAVLIYNLLFIAAHALLVFGAYALVRQLGARPTGAAVAAMAFAYAPWRLAQEGHLDIISAGGIPLALAMLARGHGWSMRYGLRPSRRHAGWAAAGWLVAAWQISLGFALGIPFAYVLGLILIVLVVGSLARRVRKPEFRALARFLRKPTVPLLGWRLAITDTLGALIFAGVALLIAVPYTRVADSPTRADEIDFFSPPLRSLLIGPAESRIWGGAHEVPRASLGWAAEMSLLPGFVLYALALAGLGFSVWRLRHRMVLMVAITFAVVLTMGTNYLGGRFTYLPLFGHYGASFDQRIPGRLMLWVTLLLAILAAGAVDDFVRRAEHLAAQRVPAWPGPWLRLAMLTPLILVALEGWNSTAHPVVPEQPAAMRTVTGPMLVLPTAELSDQTVQLWSTSEFQAIANGGGTFAATRQSELRSRVATFPDIASIEYLRSIGVGTVLLLRDQVAGTSWERAGDIPVDSLNIKREDLTDAVVFRLN
ncbi:hypothetical protein FB565_004500 [Actinoplanes lutulentus]|uniref:4-amino-4-deoxy-L-arabinose transferase-like glycosyltransferase n=1 Tax=Actinoplanes lutulentus TaxID=1287878 RepID=A0A327ZBK3_9ACTN|nr:hypothetical protein [Actinoplanes lutulentus]MBB2944767.1 hypothetical protein [Actinoplanes lutulentus]RAK35439.1 hypothetical protein B0I29_110195 [Actinoplanes lutulentus]